MILFIRHQGGKFKDDHDENYDIMCTFPQCDGTVETIHSSVPEVAGIAQATMTHMETEGLPALKEVLQAHGSDPEFQAATQPSDFLPGDLFTTTIVSCYDRNH